MKRNTKSGALLRALRALTSNRDIRVVHERPWHSLTFSGTQTCLAMKVADPTEPDIAARLTKMLENYEFHIPGQIVADIAVSQAAMSGCQQWVIIDALLLDD